MEKPSNKALFDKVNQSVDLITSKLKQQILSPEGMQKRGVWDRFKNWASNTWYGRQDKRNPYYFMNTLGDFGGTQSTKPVPPKPVPPIDTPKESNYNFNMSLRDFMEVNDLFDSLGRQMSVMVEEEDPSNLRIMRLIDDWSKSMKELLYRVLSDHIGSEKESYDKDKPEGEEAESCVADLEKKRKEGKISDADYDTIRRMIKRGDTALACKKLNDILRGPSGPTAGPTGPSGPTAGPTGSTGPTAGPTGSTGPTAGPTAGPTGDDDDDDDDEITKRAKDLQVDLDKAKNDGMPGHLHSSLSSRLEEILNGKVLGVGDSATLGSVDYKKELDDIERIISRTNSPDTTSAEDDERKRLKDEEDERKADDSAEEENKNVHTTGFVEDSDGEKLGGNNEYPYNIIDNIEFGKGSPRMRTNGKGFDKISDEFHDKMTQEDFDKLPNHTQKHFLDTDKDIRRKYKEIQSEVSLDKDYLRSDEGKKKTDEIKKLLAHYRKLVKRMTEKYEDDGGTDDFTEWTSSLQSMTCGEKISYIKKMIRSQSS